MAAKKFQQLKTLLWRNLILKKRRPFSTVLEILIPTVIIIMIGKVFKVLIIIIILVMDNKG